MTVVLRGLSWQRVVMAEGCHGRGLPWQRVASLDGLECTVHHPGSGDMADIVCHDAPVEYKKTLQFLLSTRVEPAEDNPLPYR